MTEDFIECDVPVRVGVSALSFDSGFFSFAEPLPSREEARSSSGRKYVYPGVYERVRGARSQRLPACAVYFGGERPEIDYARERAALALGALSGVGPRVLETDALRKLPDAAEGESSLALLVEEDAGVSLEEALDGAPVPFFDGGVECAGEALPSPDTPEGERTAHKILFDMLNQAYALQRQGIYHRDLRSANIAVRRWGPGADGIRATLLDLEFMSDSPRGRVQCAGYYDRLFGAGGLVQLEREPTPLEQDLGYLAVVEAEVLNGVPVRRLSDDDVLRVLNDPQSPLRVSPEGVFARRLTLQDVTREARLSGVPTAFALYGGISSQATDIAGRESMHAGYVDALDRIRLEGSVEMILEQSTMERLVRVIFENYKAHRLRDGKPLEYETYDEQSDDYKKSCIDQARSYLEKVRLLGYEVVRQEDCKDGQRVGKLSDDEVEFLAREEHARWLEERDRSGWTYGPVKNEEKKQSPFMVPWEKLSEEIREYDRDPVREMIGLLESAGLAVRR